MSRRIYHITKKEKERLERVEELNHHIPDILLNKIDNVNNFSFHSLLKEFKEKYKDALFNELEEEYNFIKDIICNLMDFCFEESFAEVVENGMRAALAETNLFGVIRERFIHPFQIFLLGAIIIDHYFTNFQEWFSVNLCASKETCVESSWLLASLFHDRLKPLKRFKGLIEFEEGGVVSIETHDEEQYLREITSLFSHLFMGRLLDEWDRSQPDEHDIFNTILKEYSEADNHGVKGSFALLRHLTTAFASGAYNPSYVEAALAISIHDHDLYRPLLANGFLPMNIIHFPIPCLLIYCDTIQEWGRGKKVDIETRLADIKFEENTILCEVAFEKHDWARNKIAEIEEVMTCIQTSGNINFTFSPRVYVSI